MCAKKNYPSWHKYEQKICYNGHGADDILPSPYSNSLSLSECKIACETDDSCEGINVLVGRGPRGSCFKKRNVQPSDCLHNSDIDLFLLDTKTHKNIPPWIKYDKKNCYSGHGAEAILPYPYSSSLSLSKCKDACKTDDSCDGIITDRGRESQGRCFKIRNIQLKDCLDDSIYDLFLLVKSQGMNHVYGGQQYYFCQLFLTGRESCVGFSTNITNDYTCKLYSDVAFAKSSNGIKSKEILFKK